jgi:hypothetical protein
LIFLFTIFFAWGHANQGDSSVFVSPRIVDQIDAVLAYYRAHEKEDPLCQGERAQRHLTALKRLRMMISSEKASFPWSLSLLKKNFHLHPFTPQKSIRLTRYAAFSVKGRRKADQAHNTPLLGLPADEEGLSEADAEARRPNLLRFKYRRSEILSGTLPPDACRPLAWLSLRDFESAQMQGSVQVVFEDGEKAVFNVSRSNGYPWKKGRPGSSQERYWFFHETIAPLGYGLWSEWQLPIFPMAALAGDLGHFGLGALVLLQSPHAVILAVVADTGGAFASNHTQLDLFLGIMETRDQYKRLNSSLPERFEAFFLE